MKNTASIDKIIAQLARRDYESAYKNYPERFKAYNAGALQRKPRGYYQFSYSLGMETEEALETKLDYLGGIISEETYKAYCLRYNLTH